MKIKTDFVTNSSSSSFVVIGINMDLNTIPIDKFQIIKSKVKVTLEELKENPWDYIDSMLKGTNLQFSQGCEYGYGELMIGIPYTEMEDDETLGDFKKRVQSQIKDVFDIDANPGHIEECWMDN